MLVCFSLTALCSLDEIACLRHFSVFFYKVNLNNVTNKSRSAIGDKS